MAENHRLIHALPERVFQVFADGWLYAGWVVGASRMRAVDDSWPQPGAELHHSFGVWPLVINDTTVVQRWEPPYRMTLEARGWPVGTAIVDLRVTPIGTDSEVTIAETPNHGPARLIPKPLADAMLRFRNMETLRRLAFFVEGGAGLPTT